MQNNLADIIHRNMAGKSLSKELLRFKPSPKRRLQDEISKKRPLKILHMLSQKPGRTGSGVCLSAMIRKGAEAGFVQRAIIGMGKEDKAEIAPLLKEDIFTVEFEKEPLDFPVPGMSDVMPYVSTRFSSFTPPLLEEYLKAFADALKRALSDFCPDIIHSHHLWLMTALTRMLMPDIPLCVSCHGTELRQLKKASHLSPYVIPACRNVDRVFALHPENMERIAESYGIDRNRILVSGAGFCEDTFCSVSSLQELNNRSDVNECGNSEDGHIERDIRKELHIVYAGKISRAKGLPWLMEAMRLVRHPEGGIIFLHIAGSTEGEEVSAIQDMAASLNVRFHGALSQKKLADLFRRSEIFVLPSLYEGLPLVVVEALACGCRAVITDLPGLMTWMPEELCEERFVRTLPLPRLIDQDTPDPRDIHLFITNLADAINFQVKQVLKNGKTPDLSAGIQSLSWSGVFEKVKKTYMELTGL